MFPDEPEGWSHLQAMAKRERDPRRLTEIISQMIRILDEREGRAAQREARGQSGGSPSGLSDE
jgi:hypothetical protein